MSCVLSILLLLPHYGNEGAVRGLTSQRTTVTDWASPSPCGAPLHWHPTIFNSGKIITFIGRDPHLKNFFMGFKKGEETQDIFCILYKHLRIMGVG